MSDEERTGSCPCCARREPQPGEVVCRPCRSRLASQVDEIPRLCELLAAGPRPELSREGVLVSIAAAAVAGQSSAPRVAGSRDRAVPISLDRTDLLSDARVLNLTKAYPEQREDQIGHLAAATILDGWCRDFAETRRESVPQPFVHRQCRYLQDRLDWAFTKWAATDPDAVSAFAEEIGRLWHDVRRAAGLTMPRPELCAGIPCRRVECDLKTLWKVPGSDWVECSSCGLLLSQDDYVSWCRLLAADARVRKTA